MPELTSILLKEIEKLNRFQIRFLKSSISSVSEDDINELEAYLQFCKTQGYTVEFIARSYDFLVRETIKEQFYFKKYGRYRYSCLAEVSGLVYSDRKYMTMYMCGVAISLFLWPNHIRMRRYFEETIPKNVIGKYLEIGPGHGLYFMKAMSITSYDYFEGIDISPASAEMTNSIMQSKVFGKFPESKYKVYECDFIKMEPLNTYNAIIAGEVLEHVESPVVFLQKLREVSCKGSYIFLTTCINAPEIDHIYLFESYPQLEALITSAGMRVTDKSLFPYVGFTLDECMQQLLPINVALILEKA